jgi:hypothetical protein
MRNRSSNHPEKHGATAGRESAADATGKAPGDAEFHTLSMDDVQVVNRHCTICEWEAQLVERGMGQDPLCPWCYGPTERTSVLGLVVPEVLRPGQKNPYASSLGRLGGLKGGPARAAKLTAKQRRDIASKAARARWAGKKTKPASAPRHSGPENPKPGSRVEDRKKKGS